MRIPAAFCGNVGLKPSFGRVPAHPLSPFGTVSHLGPHTMSVPDAALMMNVLKRPDARDWTSLPPDDTRLPRRARRRRRRAAHRLLADARVRRRATRRSPPRSPPRSRRSSAEGAIVEPVDPGFDDPLEITTGLWFTGAWTLWNTLTPEQQEVTDPDFAAEAELGSRLSSLDVQRLHLRRGELGSHMRQFMERFDLIVTPTVAVPAFEARPAGHSPMTRCRCSAGRRSRTRSTSPSSRRARSRAGSRRDGLPIGLQLVGPMFADALVLRAARAYERDHPPPRPPL